MNAQDAWSWILGHDWQILSVTTYVLLNLGPRPHPETLTGYKRFFWLVVDRLAFLSAEKVPGDWKWFFTASPLPVGVAPPPQDATVSSTAASDSATEAVTLPGKNDPPPPAA